jgi:hypothetical protein
VKGTKAQTSKKEGKESRGNSWGERKKNDVAMRREKIGVG